MDAIIKEEGKKAIRESLLSLNDGEIIDFGDFYSDRRTISVEKVVDLYRLDDGIGGEKFFSFDQAIVYFNVLIDGDGWTPVEFPIYDEIV